MFANSFRNESIIPCGLVWVCRSSHTRRPVPLQSVSIVASVVHAVAQVEISQTYLNSELNPIEASYIFPLDCNGAVTHFHAELDGKIIKGIVKSTKDAERDYKKAIQNQQTAFLGEEIKPDIFNLKVGFLKPGSYAKVVIGYVTEVKNEPDSNSIHFIIPTTVAPRYIPANANNDKSAKALGQMSFSTKAAAPLNIKVMASIQGRIQAVKSLSGHDILVHNQGVIPVQAAGNWNKVVVTLDGNVTEMDRDFVLLVTPAEAVMTPRVYYEVLNNGSMAAMAHMIPSFALPEEKAELVILLDRSGSMGGDSIRLAGAALQLFIHSLPANCYFNVVGFGSTYDFLFKGKSRKYDQKSLLVAEKYAKNVRADLGGTEILAPLKAIYAMPQIPEYSRQIFVLTDGEVSNTDDVIGLVKWNSAGKSIFSLGNSGQNRLFALGIGDSASRHLVQGIAAAGRGTAAFVESDDSISKATLSQLKNALQPSLWDVSVSWLGPIVELNKTRTLFGYNKPINPANAKVDTSKFLMTPEVPPPIFDGSQMVLFGLFPPSGGRPERVKITANSPDGPLDLEIVMDDNNILHESDMLHKLAVIKLIREMELYEASASSGFGSVLGQKIEALGIEHGISSKYTSFIAMDNSNEALVSCWSQNYLPMQSRQVPSQIPRGSRARMASLENYADFDAGDSSPEALECERVSHIAPQCHRVSTPPRVRCKMSRMEQRSRSVDHGSCRMMMCERPVVRSYQPMRYNRQVSRPSPPQPSLGERVAAIVNLQRFDGSFSPDLDTLCGLLAISRRLAKDKAEENGWDWALWATALAVAALTTTELGKERDLWELAVHKAEKWMVKNCPDNEVRQSVRWAARDIFVK